ncbi:MAG TPA: hypothetical protein VGR87_04895 [Candidatus Limnocylindria bacterium]|nr:hypothetical protein [Candidatus Limnocylindria bacterium]
MATRMSPEPLWDLPLSARAPRPYVGAYELPNQPPGGSLNHGALPSIAYVLNGIVRWTTTSGTAIDVNTGEARATPTEGFVETNPGTTTSVWYAFVVYTLSSRSLLTNGVQREIAASTMLPVPQPAGRYTLRLDMVTVEAGGRTAAVAHAGAAVVVVLEGEIELRQPQNKHDYLAPGKGLAVQPGGAMQVFDRGPATAKVLEFFYTPDSKPFETPLTTPLN